MEKRKVQSAVSEWQAEKRRRLEDGEEEVGGDADDEDVQDVQVRVEHPPLRLVVRQQGSSFPKQLEGQTPKKRTSVQAILACREKKSVGRGWLSTKLLERSRRAFAMRVPSCSPVPQSSFVA